MANSFIRLTSGTGRELWIDVAEIAAVLDWPHGTGGVTTTEIFMSGGGTFWVKETVDEVINKVAKR